MTIEENAVPAEGQTIDAAQTSAVEENTESYDAPTEINESVERQESKTKEKEGDKKAPWFQTRIDKLTAEKYEKERLAQQLKTQNEKLLEQLAVLRNGELPQTYDKQLETHTGRNFTQAEIDRLAEEKARSITAAEKFNNACNDVYEKGVSEFGTEFKEAVSTLGRVGELSRDFLEIITEIPEGHKILNHLGNDPDEAERILSLSPTKQAIAIAKLEAEVRKPASRPISQVPAPITTVSGHAQPRESLDDPKLETKKWMELRNKELDAKGKRKY